MNTVTPPGRSPSSQRRSGVARFVVRHPITAFLIGAYGVGGPLLTIFTTAPLAPFVHTAVGLGFTYIGLLGSAVAVTWVIGGTRAVHAFLVRFLMWRFGVTRWVYIVLALPVLTTALAAVSGTLHRPTDGWSALAFTFLLHTFLTGALEVNIAEEGAWSGLVQGRLADRHGVLGGALRTSPLFVAMHVPLQFAAGWTWPSVVVGVVVLTVMAPFFRYLLGETLAATGGSLLAVGILHAAFNASQQLGYPGAWQFLPAMMLLAISVGLVRKCSHGSRPASRR
jgi:membrane protease YdiL (CAAX protease family)